MDIEELNTGDWVLCTNSKLLAQVQFTDPPWKVVVKDRYGITAYFFDQVTKLTEEEAAEWVLKNG